MNPLIVAQQIAAARKVREASKWLPRLAYSTVTGDAPRIDSPTYEAEMTLAAMVESHCYVCGRHTDHFAEHDEFVARGVAEYDSYSGSVYRTSLWEERPDLVQAARDEVDASVAAWLAALPA